MTSNPTSVSLTDAESDFLECYNLSPTALLKEKIGQEKIIIEKYASERIREIEESRKRITEHRDKALRFIEAAGMMDKFLNE